MVNLVLVLLVLAFGTWEMLAGFFQDGALAPMITLSEVVWGFENRHGVWGQAAVALGCLFLFSHLVFQWPLGPDR